MSTQATLSAIINTIDPNDYARVFGPNAEDYRVIDTSPISPTTLLINTLSRIVATLSPEKHDSASEARGYRASWGHRIALHAP